MINGKTRTCGVMGNPIEHTFSPAIHNFLAAKMEENLVYVPFHVPEGCVKEAVEGAFALNILGCNVTVPYKMEVIPHLVGLDPLAEKIGAVNTLVRKEDGFYGYNTDMPGLYRAMIQDNVRIEGENIVILGAGGVARACGVLAAEKGAKRIIILNRTVDKAKQVAEEINQMYDGRLVEAYGLEEYPEVLKCGDFIAIQATSVGMYPKVNEAVVEDAEFYQYIKVGYDLVFNPGKTRFMELAEEMGARSFNGMKMLLYQGIIAYELWTGREVPMEYAGGAYERMKSHLQGDKES